MKTGSISIEKNYRELCQMETEVYNVCLTVNNNTQKCDLFKTLMEDCNKFKNMKQRRIKLNEIKERKIEKK
tara:strand:- start:38 stop:250 length:213 start_codon:yes stop_codon:yes gene_type:complete